MLCSCRRVSSSSIKQKTKQGAFRAVGGGYSKTSYSSMRHSTRNGADRLCQTGLHRISLLRSSTGAPVGYPHVHRSQQESGRVTLQSVRPTLPAFLEGNVTSRKKKRGGGITRDSWWWGSTSIHPSKAPKLLEGST